MNEQTIDPRASTSLPFAFEDDENGSQTVVMETGIISTSCVCFKALRFFSRL